MQVSHTYSKEVSGNPVIAPNLYKFHGILNGIDPDIWDPYNDKFIPVSILQFFVVLLLLPAKWYHDIASVYWYQYTLEYRKSNLFAYSSLIFAPTKKKVEGFRCSIA